MGVYRYDPDLNWNTLRTEHFSIHFHKGELQIAERVSFLTEQERKRLVAYFEWDPGEIEIVLTDRVDVVNAYATVLPSSLMVFYVVPPENILVFDQYEDWLQTLVAHEMEHFNESELSLVSVEKTESIQ